MTGRSCLPLSDHPVLVVPLALAEFVLLYLPRRRLRELLDELDPMDCLVGGHVLLRERLNLLFGHARFVGVARGRNDERLRRLAPLLAGGWNDGNVRHV